ncbi:hypothetical protein OAL43_02795 [bacterium]|nr:hypothetical protein [bacterium]MDC0279113.1 hypothetical protein [bacterium]
MKKFAFAFSVFAALFCIGFVGCTGGSTETSVVEAPPADEGQAMDEMSDDEYDKEMEASMSSQE